MLLSKQLRIIASALQASLILVATVQAFAVPPPPGQVKARLEYPAEPCRTDLINLNPPHQMVKQSDTRCCPYKTHYCSYPKGTNVNDPKGNNGIYCQPLGKSTPSTRTGSNNHNCFPMANPF